MSIGNNAQKNLRWPGFPSVGEGGGGEGGGGIRNTAESIWILTLCVDWGNKTNIDRVVMLLRIHKNIIIIPLALATDRSL